MANEEHLRILWQGSNVWNQWRKNNPTTPNLINADLREADLFEANLSKAFLMKANLFKADMMKANLKEANLSSAYMREANLSNADLTRAKLIRSDLFKADLNGTNLMEANMIGSDLSGADLTGANLSIANLSRTILIETNFKMAILSGCNVYGVSAWGLNLDEAKQSDLIITTENEPIITVDNLEVAQFIYLLLHNPKIRDVIDTIAKKAVLILGSFKEERKKMLDAIREELRRRDYLPIMFDFEKPAHRNTAETVSTLAHISKFIIADITDAKSIPAELERIVPKLPSVPVQPLILSSEEEYGMFDSIKCLNQVLETYRYDNRDMLLENLKERVIDPAEAKARELIPPAANR